MQEPVKRTIKQLLDEGTFKIPKFQRSFSWGLEETNDLWEDLTRLSEEPLFLGSMVIKTTNKEKMFEVIDGQQRLSTIIIFLAAIRDSLQKLESDDAKEKAMRIHNFIYYEDLTSGGPFPKIKLNKYDDDYFFTNIINKDLEEIDFRNTRGKKDSEKLISKVYYSFFDNFQSVPTTLQFDKLNKYLSLLLDKVEIIKIEVKDIGQAYIIFETLNARGVELTTADLVKNFLYSNAASFSSECLDETEQRWDNMVSYTSGILPITSFLKHYWASEIDLIRDKQLFKNIKNKFETDCRTQTKFLQFVKLLEKNCEIYTNLFNPLHSFINNHEIETILKSLKVLKVKSCYPLLLNSYQRMNKTDFLKLLKLIEVLSFRYNTISEKNPNELERKYSEWAIQKVSLNPLLAKIKIYIPDDETFKSDFMQKSIKNEAINRYVLRRIGKFQIHERIIEISDSEEITLEHIMPKSLSREWKDYIIKHNEIEESLTVDEFVKKFHQDNLNKIANLTLLHIKDNRRLRNSTFDIKKRDCFSRSLYLPNRDIGHIDIWNEETINKRQERLVKDAISVWSINRS